MLFDDGNIEHDEFQIYCKWFDEFLDDVKLSGIIYVKAKPEICDDRVKKRGRDGENIPLEYLQKCHAYHERWLGNIETHILDIDANVDTSNDKTIRDQWVTTIDEWMRGIA